jgi:hypothetical protein
MFQLKMLKEMLVPKRDELSEKFKNLCNEELLALYSSSCYVRM